MSKPKVLVFIDWYLPGTKAGGPVRSCANLIDHLSGKVEFSIVTTDTDYTEEQPYSDVQSDRWVDLEAGSRVWYCSKEHVNKATFAKLIAEQNYDAYYINGMYSKNFSILPLRILKKQKKKAKVIVAVRGMLAQGAMQFGTLKKKTFLKMAKLTGLYKNVLFQATNEKEAQDIQQYLGEHTQVAIIPNLPRSIQPLNSKVEKARGTLKVLCLARIAVEKNTLFAIDLLSRISGDVQLDFCGTVYDEDYWGKCKRSIKELPQNVSVQHIDGVDGSEVPELLAKYHVMVLPSLGENFGHVIFESLSVGRPVIVSDRTPWQGLQDEKAGYVLSLSDPDTHLEALQQFVEMDQQEYNTWSNAAFEYALRYLAQDNTKEEYLALFIG